MNFASDNVYGVHPQIINALAEVNSGTAPSYANDDYSKKSEEELSRVFEKDVRAFLVTTGTVANGLSLSTITPGHGAIICHVEAHISWDECNSPEFFTGGAKILGLAGPGGKLTPVIIREKLKTLVRNTHDPKPKGVSITNASELGTVYSPTEIQAISDLIRPRGMKLHMDGARFANAVAGLNCSPADLTWKSGVDVMSFGATKNGAMMLEAVVFFDSGLAEEFSHRRMRAGQLVSKGRYLGAQMLAYLKDDLWLENARIANGLARQLADGLLQHTNIRIPDPVQANEIFAVLPRSLCAKLMASGAKFYDRPDDSLAADEIMIRLVLSFATPAGDVKKFLGLVRELNV
jgi:threonine aldolase